MVLRGKPVGEQGAADRWTALPYRCGAGPPGAPLLFCLPGAAAAPGPPAPAAAFVGPRGVRRAWSRAACVGGRPFPVG